MRKVLGEDRGDGDVRGAEQEAEDGGHPRLEWHHGVGEKHHEHHLPGALRRHPGRHGGRVDGQRQRAERGEEEEDGVADPEQVGVLHEAGVQEAEQQREQNAVRGVVHVLCGGRLRVDEAQTGQHRRQQHE